MTLLEVVEVGHLANPAHECADGGVVHESVYGGDRGVWAGVDRADGVAGVGGDEVVGGVARAAADDEALVGDVVDDVAVDDVAADDDVAAADDVAVDDAVDVDGETGGVVDGAAVAVDEAAVVAVPVVASGGGAAVDDEADDDVVAVL